MNSVLVEFKFKYDNSFRLWRSGLWHHVDMYVDSDVLEECAASIFRVNPEDHNLNSQHYEKTQNLQYLVQLNHSAVHT